MTIREALVRGTEILNNAGVETPGADAGVMLCHIINCDRAFLYAHGGDVFDNNAAEKFTFYLQKRCSGMPVQYITGKQEFMSLEFHVTPDVLIPRHDTEILVETVMKYAHSLKRGIRILDIGTGSGCIAVSLARYIRNCLVVAVDISQKALDIARFNAIKNGVCRSIEFVRSNLFENISFECFDIIVSNPPYIKPDVIMQLRREVKDFEPINALDGGLDGLMYYRRITKYATCYLKAGGLLAYEVGIGQSSDVAKLMGYHFKGITSIKDLNGIDRVVTGCLIK